MEAPSSSHYQQQQQQQVPLPVSLTLYNLYVESNLTTRNKNLMYRPEYTRDLLVPVRLDIVFSSSSSSSSSSSTRRTRVNKQPLSIDNKDTTTTTTTTADENDDEILLYSSTLHNKGGMIHPSWNHLQERIETLQESSSSTNTVVNDDDSIISSIYPNMTCKLIGLLIGKKKSDCSISSSDESEQEEEVVLATIPLHPSQLRRLPPSQADITNENENETETTPPLLLSLLSSEQQQQQQQRSPLLPKRLPPNSVLISFTDGSTRVCPSLYHYLVKEKVIVERDPQDASLIQDNQEEYKRQLRFDNNVFDTLNDDCSQEVVWWQQQQQQQHEENKRRKQRPSPILSSLLDNAQDELKHGESQLADLTTTLSSSSSSSSSQEGGTKRSRLLPMEIESVVADLKREKEQLELLLAQEEVCLEQEIATLHENESTLKELMERVQKVEKEIVLMQLDSADKRRKQQELDFCLEAQRIKLLEELRMIYPIRGQAEETWFIRGQEIPKDLHAGGISEEEISAALGFMAHSVVMIAKYLSIPLRYRIVCNSSRSAVQQDATTILPLFQARMVEREELDRAMVLMGRNVACILKTRGIIYSEDAHILRKVNRIYESIVDGR